MVEWLAKASGRPFVMDERMWQKNPEDDHMLQANHFVLACLHLKVKGERNDT